MNDLYGQSLALYSFLSANEQMFGYDAILSGMLYVRSIERDYLVCHEIVCHLCSLLLIFFFVGLDFSQILTGGLLNPNLIRVVTNCVYNLFCECIGMLSDNLLSNAPALDQVLQDGIGQVVSVFDQPQLLQRFFSRPSANGGASSSSTNGETSASGSTGNSGQPGGPSGSGSSRNSGQSGNSGSPGSNGNNGNNGRDGLQQIIDVLQGMLGDLGLTDVRETLGRLVDLRDLADDFYASGRKQDGDILVEIADLLRFTASVPDFDFQNIRDLVILGRRIRTITDQGTYVRILDEIELIEVTITFKKLASLSDLEDLLNLRVIIRPVSLHFFAA